MRIIERRTQEITTEGWKVLGEMERAFDAAEAKMGGVPPKRRYFVMYGGSKFGTMIWERDWESMAALETYAVKTGVDPDMQAVIQRAGSVYANNVSELLVHFDDVVK